MDLRYRNTESELMDNPNVTIDTLRLVFNDINKSNRFLGGNSITLGKVSELIKEFPKKQYTIVDMGCGDGEALRKLAIYFRKIAVDVELIGLDLSENALSIGRALSVDFPEITFLKQDILTLKPLDLNCDILLCTLTMHHFSNQQIPLFLSQFTKLAKIGVIINDLQRSVLAYYLFKGFSAIFIKTKIAKHDGLISIKSGFKKQDLISFSKNLPNTTHTINWKWAFRYVWVMQTAQLSRSYE
ncbi:methyltransferase domain-containing protein [uncultured Eudoraea sp.]|uniref:methyltransferase domain-containing protein n=1 Tax=uncultured Eudoraea sp. TaxID=1035614 RepID=UPI002623FEF6|nr:methyltransferase domain-containing protein [uncultured Eudoraea sp.]